MRLLLIGGGHAHVEVLRQMGLRRSEAAGLQAVLVSPDRFTPYSGMMPGWIAGHYSRADCHIDLEPLAAFGGVRFARATVTGLDLAARRARLDDAQLLEFDAVSIDIGSTPPLDAIPGARQHALAVKPVGEFLESLEALAVRATGGAVNNIVMIGGGAAGVEVLLAIRYRLRQEGAARPEYAVVTDAPVILSSHNARTRHAFERIYRRLGIAIHAGVAVAAVDAGGVVLADGRTIPSDATIVATGAAAAAWPGTAGLATDARGFIRLDRHLRSISHRFAFAAGDCAAVEGPPYPKSGVYAVRQGPVLAANLIALARQRPLRRNDEYIPQPHALALISAGERYAVASRGPFAVAGRWVWRWKDMIDRRFMAKYTRVGLAAALSKAR